MTPEEKRIQALEYIIKAWETMKDDREHSEHALQCMVFVMEELKVLILLDK